MERLAEITPGRAAPPSWARQAGSEPLPGYRLLEPLGHGGFGEVWKCEAPGGLLKAVKFVRGDSEELGSSGALAEQEWSALQRIRAIRHPFLLSMERVEILAGELVIVMELADRGLHNVLAERRAAGLPGIPRAELLAYLREAAEALDVLNLRHGLQHLDVKPANLLLLSDHVKVADFGLVRSLSEAAARPAVAGPAGFTPRYAAPETLQGGLSPRSDQYSLALVYQELLTGTFPFSGKNPRQLFLQHLTVDPDLGPLPAADRAAVARALAKEPEQRFPSCLNFVEALARGTAAVPGTRPAAPRRSGELELDLLLVGDRNMLARPLHRDPRERFASCGELVQALAGAPAARVRGGRSLGQRLPLVLPVARLSGAPTSGGAPMPSHAQLVHGLLAFAGGTQEEYTERGFQYFLRPGNVLEHRCAIRAFAGGLPLKLDGFRRQWCADVTRRDEGSVVLHLAAPRGFWEGRVGRQVGLKVHVQQPLLGTSAQWSEVTVRVQPFGASDAAGAELLADVGPTLLVSVRAYLQAEPQRRAAERWPCLHPLRLYPVSAEGECGPALQGMGRDLSRGGIGLMVAGLLTVEHVYVHLDNASHLAGHALLARLVWAQPGGDDGWCQAGAVFPAGRPWQQQGTS